MPTTKRILPVLIVLTVLVALAGALGVTVAIAISSAPDPLKMSAYPILEEGSTGGFVDTLQTRLNVWNVQPRLSVGGDFDRPTLESVEAFQLAKKLPYNGIVGQETWQALLAAPPHKDPAIRLSTEVRSEEHTSELQSPCNLVC